MIGVDSRTRGRGGPKLTLDALIRKYVNLSEQVQIALDKAQLKSMIHVADPN